MEAFAQVLSMRFYVKGIGLKILTWHISTDFRLNAVPAIMQTILKNNLTSYSIRILGYTRIKFFS